jgi:hypothetical protein
MADELEDLIFSSVVPNFMDSLRVIPTEYSTIEHRLQPFLINLLNNIPNPEIGKEIREIPEEYYINLDKIKEKDLICPVCSCVVDVVCILNKCNHKFCSNCVYSLVKNNKLNCPLCRTKFDNVIISQNFTSYLNDQEIECKCKSIMKRETYLTHKKECPLAEFSCKMCGKTISNKTEKIHLRDECVERTVSCEKCNALIAFSKLKTHLCPFQESECSICGLKGTLKDIEQHKCDCPNKLVKCRWCLNIFYNKDLTNHEKNCPNIVICKKCERIVFAKDYNQHSNLCNNYIKCQKCLAFLPNHEYLEHCDNCVPFKT